MKLFALVVFLMCAASPATADVGVADWRAWRWSADQFYAEQEEQEFQLKSQKSARAELGVDANPRRPGHTYRAQTPLHTQPQGAGVAPRRRRPPNQVDSKMERRMPAGARPSRQMAGDAREQERRARERDRARRQADDQQRERLQREAAHRAKREAAEAKERAQREAEAAEQRRIEEEARRKKEEAKRKQELEKRLLQEATDASGQVIDDALESELDAELNDVE